MISILSFLTVYLNAAISLLTGNSTGILENLGTGFEKFQYGFAALVNLIF